MRSRGSSGPSERSDSCFAPFQSVATSVVLVLHLPGDVQGSARHVPPMALSGCDAELLLGLFWTRLSASSAMARYKRYKLNT